MTEPSGHAACVVIDDLHCSYGEFEAVAGVSLQIESGTLFGLLGPNGAGKTTLLSTIATLHRATRGDVRVFGHSVSHERERVRRRVGICPQELSLYPDLTGTENVRFFGSLHGLRGRALEDATDRALDRVGLEARARRRAHEYSGGMLRRLNLACSLVHAPKLLLLDEPTVGVDPQSRDRLLETVRAVAAEGTTVVYTTHYMEEAERLCDRIAILDAGRVIAEGSPQSLVGAAGATELVELRGLDGRIDEQRFRSLPGVVHLESDGEALRLHLESAAVVLGTLASLLEELEGPAPKIVVRPQNLETIFMRLTGRELRD